jgi:hypothetical protein
MTRLTCRRTDDLPIVPSTVIHEEGVAWFLDRFEKAMQRYDMQRALQVAA